MATAPSPRLRVVDLAPRGLEPVSFDLAAGDCVVVRGPSGAGKTLLLRAIADLDPHPGECFLDGAPRSAMPAPSWRRRVGYLPASPGFWTARVAAQFEWPERATVALTELGMTADLLGREIERLSTGERLRLALLRALEPAPSVLLLDEPTGPLDPDSTAAVERRLAAERERGLALLWVTHDAAQARRIATRELVVDGGVVREAVLHR